MKAVNLGGAVKSSWTRASRFAAGLLGLATREGVSALRSAIQSLEDTIAAS
jgi:hypothetical protein